MSEIEKQPFSYPTNCGFEKLLMPLANLIRMQQKTSASLDKLCLFTSMDLLLYQPVRLEENKIYTFRLISKSGRFVARGRTGSSFELKGFCPEEDSNIKIKFYTRPYSWDNLEEEKEYYFVKQENEGLAVTHPKYFEEVRSNIPEFENRYRLTSGITNRTLSRITRESLKFLDKVTFEEEWFDQNTISSLGFPSWKKALGGLHDCSDSDFESILQKQNLSRLRLLADEVLIYKIFGFSKKKYTAPFIGKDRENYREHFLKGLDFSLTESQRNAIEEIDIDIESGKSMNRLLLGDVGTGKTIVAFMAMLKIVELGYRTCLMVPTQVLATQHFQNLQRLLEKSGLNKQINLSLITGNKDCKNLKDFEGDILIGTHALFYHRSQIKNLGLIVVDEQHRFGLAQRVDLVKYHQDIKDGPAGKEVVMPHTLSMTATPIPRTLFLSQYFGFSTSRLESIGGRKPVKTISISKPKIEKLVERIKCILAKGEQVYWVCSLVEESEADEKSAKSRFAYLKENLPEASVGLLYGSMHSKTKDKTLKDFLDSEIQVLVSTTVVEVGVDAKNATVIVIEDADRFGLVQLHQLRGRVGRNDLDSYCILIIDKSASNTSRKRLEILKNCHDAFALSKEDLKMRGKGNLKGVRQDPKQSGGNLFKFGSAEEAEAMLPLVDKVVIDKLSDQSHKLLKSFGSLVLK